MNPLYQMLTGQMYPQNQQMPVQQNFSGIQFQNPIQKANFIMQAMRNPVAFVKQAVPDLPSDIANDPNRILQYLQQTRGITNEQIQEAASYIPRW